MGEEVDCLGKEGWGVSGVDGLDVEGWCFFRVDTSGGKLNVHPFGQFSKRRLRARLALQVVGLHLFSLLQNFAFSIVFIVLQPTSGFLLGLVHSSLLEFGNVLSFPFCFYLAKSFFCVVNNLVKFTMNRFPQAMNPPRVYLVCFRITTHHFMEISS